jgi:TRAP transporter 4TM/12TM fusion protein
MTQNRAVRAMAIALVLFACFFTLDVPSFFGVSFFPQQFLGIELSLALAIVFLKYPARRASARDRAPWYDVLLAALGGVCGAYVVLWFPRIAYEIAFPTADKIVLGTIVLILTFEACRRVYGWVLPVVSSAFVLYAAFASEAPGIFRARSVPWSRMTTELFLGPDGVLGVAFSVVATIVLVYVLFGQLLFAMGGGVTFTDVATALLGRYRGGPAKVAVLGSALFGSISGSAVANVAITGTITIPMMKRQGYPAHVAAGVEAAASTGGLVAPPVMSVVAFLMAEYLQVPYSRIVVAAALPAVLYFAAILVQVDLEAGRRGISGLSPAEIPRLGPVLRTGWPFLVPVPVLLVTLVGLSWEPSKAGMFSVLVLLAAGFWFVREKPLSFWLDALAGVGTSASEILVIGAIVGLIVGSAAFTGLGFTLSLPLLELSQSSVLLFLVATALSSIVLGMGLPGIAIYFMQVALIVPTLVEFGVPPLAAHFFIYYFGVFSFITPPVAIAAIAAAGMAGAPPMRTAWEAVKLGAVAFLVPFAFVLSPSLLGEGPIGRTAVDFTTAAFGVIMLSGSIRGYLASSLSRLERVAAGAASLALFLPLGVVPEARIWNAAGTAAGAALVFFSFKRRSARDLPAS